MAPPSPNTTRGDLWEIAPVPILQLLSTLPGIAVSSDDRRNDMRQSELRDRRNLFDDVVAIEDFLGDESARVAGDDRDRLGRVDEVPGDVLAAVSCVCTDGVRLGQVPARAAIPWHH